MDPRKVDPAAMLIAVFAVAVGPLTEEGEWAWMNSLTCLVVLLVLILFTWPDHRPRRGPLYATSIVVAFVSGVGLAWVFQEVWVEPNAVQVVNPSTGELGLSETDIDRSTIWGLAGGFFVGVIYGFALWRRPPLPADT